ncbi:PDGLE domain-containing protein [Nocardioides sp. YIM 152315]|uniref:PDGLE domain-containing protein n=1 Tax=Nocardioides sp. YIM 152315 TaxID=3031760 RepID=UPI0023DC2E79|nr:PDGLE domain-containing protein [Nocardioides sp. YIM 152315]MDF1606424.1 PDGLE domain-containing protein [Nocardioides sp. YIM 152315]
MKNVPTKWVLVGVGVAALVLAGIVSFYASGSPDGLTKVSEDKGFADTETAHGSKDSPFAGYATKDVGNERLSGGLAGVVGVVVVLALGAGLVYVVRRRTPASDRSTDREHEPVD